MMLSKLDKASAHDIPGHKGRQNLLTHGNLPSLVLWVAVFDPPMLLCYFFLFRQKAPLRFLFPVERPDAVERELKEGGCGRA